MKMPSFGSLIQSVCLLTAVMAVSMSVLIASTSSAYSLTFKSGEKKSFNNSTNSNDSGVSTNSKIPTKFLKDLITQKIKAEDLSDEKLCLSLKYLDLPSTFYEMQRRGLSCLHSSIPQENWYLPTRDEAFKYLREYQKKNNVDVPEFNPSNAQPVFGDVRQTVELYQALNPQFYDLEFNFGLKAGRVNRRIQFCLDWYGTVSFIVEGQSKGLDGSASWGEGTLKDGFAICSGNFTGITLRSLSDERVAEQLKSMIKNWAKNDGLRRDVTSPLSLFFSVKALNNVSIALEMLEGRFEWNEDEKADIARWLKRRALEMYPADTNKSPSSDLCPKKIRSDFKNHYEACKNGGILRAQALLRIGIWTGDQEFIEMSYLTFHRYMSGHRPDGSNIGDSVRGCQAADYNIWASQFMSDFMFQWSRISAPLWDVEFHDTLTPSKAVEYSLSLIGNFEAINKHTAETFWDVCGKDKKNRTQEATTKYGVEWYPKVSFAPYFDHNGLLIETLLNYDRSFGGNYVAQSGVNYEIALLLQQPELVEELRGKILEVRMSKLLAGVPKSIKELGLTINEKTEYVPRDTDQFAMRGLAVNQYRPSKTAGDSDVFKVQFSDLRIGKNSFSNLRFEFWEREDERMAIVFLDDLFDDEPKLKKAFKKIDSACKLQQIVKSGELELAIRTRWPEAKDYFECLAKNTKSNEVKELFLLTSYAASVFDAEAAKAEIASRGQLKNINLTIADDGYVSLIDPSLVDIGDYTLEEVVKPKSAKKSTKYRLRFKRVTVVDQVSGKTNVAISNQRVTIYEQDKSRGRARKAGIWLGDILERYPASKSNWQKIWEICPFEDDDRETLELPIVHNDWLHPLISCFDKNVEDQRLRSLMMSLVKIGNEVELSSS